MSSDPHCNPEVTRLKVARVDGFDIIVGIDTEKGLYIYFPVGCAIDPEFLKLNNLFRDKDKNSDQKQNLDSLKIMDE